MNTQRMVVWVASATMAATAALVGCSSTTTTSTGGAGTTVGTPPGTTVRVPGSTPIPAASTPASSIPTGPTGTAASSSAEFCTRIEAADQMTKASSGSTKKDKPTQQDIKAFTTALAAARDAGPAEIKESLDTLITAYEKYATISDDPSKESQAAEIFFDDKVLAAGTKVETVVKAECGYELKTGGSSSSTTDGTSVVEAQPRR